MLILRVSSDWLRLDLLELEQFFLLALSIFREAVTFSHNGLSFVEDLVKALRCFANTLKLWANVEFLEVT